jgi:hypothetical protein
MGRTDRPPRNPLRRWQLRREADRTLLADGHPRIVPSWRVRELTSAHERRLLARSLRGVLNELDGRVLPGASPLNRAGVRPHAAEIEMLAKRLEDERAPVSPHGIVLVREFLTAPGGPLYAHERTAETPERVRAILSALERARG